MNRAQRRAAAHRREPVRREMMSMFVDEDGDGVCIGIGRADEDPDVYVDITLVDAERLAVELLDVVRGACAAP